MRPSEIAVLYRINAQSEVYEQALADASVPYQLRGAERFFERPEVREAGMLLRGAARASIDPGEGEATIPQQVRDVLSSRGWASEPPAGSGAVRDRWESLAAIVRLSEDFTAARPTATLADFVAELDERANAQHAPTVEGVTLASLHAAKGLEWDAVFLVGLTEGTLPITYAKTDEQIEEERRLLYVGVTRARYHLNLSWALSRSRAAAAAAAPPASSTDCAPARRSAANAAPRRAVPGRNAARAAGANAAARCSAGCAAAPCPTRARSN